MPEEGSEGRKIARGRNEDKNGRGWGKKLVF